MRIVAFDPLGYAAVALFWILFHSWPLLPGLLAKAFFDFLEGSAPAGLTLASLVALVIAAGIARAGVVLGATLVGRPYGFKLRGWLRRNIFTRILARPGAQPLPESTGEVISTLRDDVEMIGLLADWLFDSVAGLIFAAGGIAILLWVDARVTLLVFALIAAVVIITSFVRTRIEHLRIRSRAATAQVTGSLGEIFGAVQAIQAAGAEEPVVAHLRRLGDARRDAMLQDRLLALSLDAVFAATSSLGAGLTLLVAASALHSGEFSVGDFALFATYLMQVADYTGFLGYLIHTYRQMSVSFRRAFKLIEPAPPDHLVDPQPLRLYDPLPSLPAVIRRRDDRLETLEARGLTLRYAENGQGIEDISFTLRGGALTVITGRIGSGKTTLLRALLGLLETQAGAVYWNGRQVEQPAEFMIPPRVAYTPQAPALLSGSVRENILLGWPEPQRLAQAVEQAVLEQDLASFPDGLETLIGPRGLRLSGGQAQRTGAARMFVRAPELLVFDDLSSALDVETERMLWQRLFARGATCLAVSHRPAVLAQADQVLMLEGGRLIQSER
jgi:ATP-binding cassette subfamily B protein